MSICLRNTCFICRGQFYCHVQTSICWIHGVGLVVVRTSVVFEYARVATHGGRWDETHLVGYGIETILQILVRGTLLVTDGVIIILFFHMKYCCVVFPQKIVRVA